LPSTLHKVLKGQPLHFLRGWMVFIYNYLSPNLPLRHFRR
jgi:hypothetical protein